MQADVSWVNSLTTLELDQVLFDEMCFMDAVGFYNEVECVEKLYARIAFGPVFKRFSGRDGAVSETPNAVVDILQRLHFVASHCQQSLSASAVLRYLAALKNSAVWPPNVEHVAVWARTQPVAQSRVFEPNTDVHDDKSKATEMPVPLPLPQIAVPVTRASSPVNYAVRIYNLCRGSPHAKQVIWRWRLPLEERIREEVGLGTITQNLYCRKIKTLFEKYHLDASDPERLASQLESIQLDLCESKPVRLVRVIEIFKEYLREHPLGNENWQQDAFEALKLK
jgi:hypothetical protein